MNYSGDQRPEIPKDLERLKGRVAKDGTYGLMQVRSQGPISDKQSIESAVSKYFANTAGAVGEDTWDRLVRLRPVAATYNENPNFVDMVMQAIEVGSTH
jgi:hypothetical protein